MGEPIINGHFGKGKIDMVHNSTRITWKHLGAQQAMLHSWTMVVYIRVIRCLSPYFCFFTHFLYGKAECICQCLRFSPVQHSISESHPNHHPVLLPCSHPDETEYTVWCVQFNHRWKCSLMPGSVFARPEESLTVIDRNTASDRSEADARGANHFIISQPKPEMW